MGGFQGVTRQTQREHLGGDAGRGIRQNKHHLGAANVQHCAQVKRCSVLGTHGHLATIYTCTITAQNHEFPAPQVDIIRDCRVLARHHFRWAQINLHLLRRRSSTRCGIFVCVCVCRRFGVTPNCHRKRLYVVRPVPAGDLGVRLDLCGDSMGVGICACHVRGFLWNLQGRNHCIYHFRRVCKRREGV